MSDRYKAVVERVDELALKTKSGRLSAEEDKEFLSLLEEGEALKTQAAMAGRAATFSQEARRGLGMPLLASPTGSVALQTLTPAGEAEVEWESGRTKDGRNYKSTLISDSGEMLIDEAQYRTISNPSYAKSFEQYVRRGERHMKADGLKLLQEGIDTAGGFLVPEDLISRIVQRKPTPTRIAGRVTRLTTSRDSVALPKLNYTTDNVYTTGIRVTWTGEVPASATQARVVDPVFGQIRIPVFTGMMSLPLTNDMVEDSAFPILDFVSGKFEETIRILYDQLIMTGTGQGQASGILMNPGGPNQPAVINTGDANLITPDSLINLAFDLPEQYDEGSAYYFNKTSTGKSLATMKDSTGRYIWGNGTTDSGLSVPWKDRKIEGYDCVLSQIMPNVAANTFPVVFGDLTGYYLVQRLSFSMQVLRELYAETNQILLLGRIRVGGMTAEEWKMRILKISA